MRGRTLQWPLLKYEGKEGKFYGKLKKQKKNSRSNFSSALFSQGTFTIVYIFGMFNVENVIVNYVL